MDKGVDDLLPHEIGDIVKFHSKGGATAALASAWIPGAGGSCCPYLCRIYLVDVCSDRQKIGLPFGKNVLKSLASGVATNLASAVVGVIVLSTALSFIPGLGNIGASVIMGATSYALTLASGYVYLKIMTKLFKEGIDLSAVSEQELQDMAASAAKESDVQEVIKEAKADFRTKKKQGEFK